MRRLHLVSSCAIQLTQLASKNLEEHAGNQILILTHIEGLSSSLSLRSAARLAKFFFNPLAVFWSHRTPSESQIRRHHSFL